MLRRRRRRGHGWTGRGYRGTRLQEVASYQVRLDRVLQTLRFRDGTVVRTRNERHVYLDPGDDNEAFYAVLHRTLFGKGRP